MQLARDRGQCPGEESRSVHIALPECPSAFPLHCIVFVLNYVACSQQVRVTNMQLVQVSFLAAMGFPDFTFFLCCGGGRQPENHFGAQRPKTSKLYYCDVTISKYCGCIIGR